MITVRSNNQDLTDLLWGDTMYFESSHPTRGTTRVNAEPAVAIYSVMWLLRLVDPQSAQIIIDQYLVANTVRWLLELINL